MLFSKQKIIFIHIGKTGGNYFSRCFVRFSDDHRVILPNTHQVLSDRFGIQGPHTQKKHQTLDIYQENMGGSLNGYRIFSVLRHPVERLISLYFSPHHWMQPQENGSFRQIGADKTFFNEARFNALINRVPSTWLMLDAINCTQPLTLDRPIQHNSGAEIHLVPFDDIENRWKQFAKDEGFDDANFPGRRVNPSASPTLKDQMLKDDRDYLEDLIYATHHLKDLAFFE